MTRLNADQLIDYNKLWQFENEKNVFVNKAACNWSARAVAKPLFVSFIRLTTTTSEWYEKLSRQRLGDHQKIICESFAEIGYVVLGYRGYKGLFLYKEYEKSHSEYLLVVRGSYTTSGDRCAWRNVPNL